MNDGTLLQRRAVWSPPRVGVETMLHHDPNVRPQFSRNEIARFGKIAARGRSIPGSEVDYFPIWVTNPPIGRVKDVGRSSRDLPGIRQTPPEEVV